jgi:hypothetical protein
VRSRYSAFKEHRERKAKFSIFGNKEIEVNPTSNSSKLAKYQHARKSDLYLKSNPAYLTDDAINATIKLCLHNFYDHYEAVMALAVLLCGLSVKDIYKKCVARQEHTLFKSSLELAIVATDNELFKNSATEAYISLPRCFHAMIVVCNLKEIGEEEINLFLHDNLPAEFRDVSVNRLSKLLKFKASDFGFSDVELEFMRLSDKPKVSLIYYVRLNLTEVNRKHQSYQRELLKGHEQDAEFMQVVDYKPSGYFGSHQVLKMASVKQLFSKLTMQLSNAVYSEEDLRTLYNNHTTFVVYILEISTSHRPNKSEFGTIDMFALDAKTLFLRDKGGDSTRIALLSDFAVDATKQYITFLLFLAKQLFFINRNVYDRLQACLNGTTSLFGTWMGNMIKEYKPSRHKGRERPKPAKEGKSTSQVENDNIKKKELFDAIPSNWARHYVANLLFTNGFHFDDIQRFMGQDPVPLSPHNKYSSCDDSVQHQICVAIEQHLKDELGLSTSIFEFVRTCRLEAKDE